MFFFFFFPIHCFVLLSVKRFQFICQSLSALLLHVIEIFTRAILFTRLVLYLGEFIAWVYSKLAQMLVQSYDFVFLHHRNVTVYAKVFVNTAFSNAFNVDGREKIRL